MTDRVADALILGGVAWYLVSTHPGHLVLLPFAVLGATSLVSYQRAKAESLGISAKGGLMERAERMILLGIGFLSAVVPGPRAVGHAGPDHGDGGRTVRQGLAPGRGPGPGGRPSGAPPASAAATSPGRAGRPLDVAVAVAGPSPGRAVQPVRPDLAGPARPDRASANAPAADTPESSGHRAERGRGLVNKGQAVFRTYTTLGRCLAALPEPVALGVANVVGDVLFRVRHEHRPMVSDNLRRVLGADAATDDRSSSTAGHARSFRAYARYWVEGARLGRRRRSRSSSGRSSRGWSIWWRGWRPERASSWHCRMSGAGSTGARSWPRRTCR